MRPLHSIEEVAERFNVSVKTAKQRCRDGVWPHLKPAYRTWQFSDEDIDAIEARVHVQAKQIAEADAWGRVGKAS